MCGVPVGLGASRTRTGFVVSVMSASYQGEPFYSKRRVRIRISAMEVTDRRFELRLKPRPRTLQVIFFAFFAVFTASAVWVSIYTGRIAFLSAGLATSYGLSLLLPMLIPDAGQRTLAAAWVLPIEAGLVCATVAAGSDWGRLFLIAIAVGNGLQLITPFDVEIGETALTFRWGIRSIRRDYDKRGDVSVAGLHEKPSLTSIRLMFKQPTRRWLLGPIRHDQTIWLRTPDAERFVADVSARLDAAKIL